MIYYHFLQHFDFDEVFPHAPLLRGGHAEQGEGGAKAF